MMMEMKKRVLNILGKCKYDYYSAVIILLYRLDYTSENSNEDVTDEPESDTRFNGTAVTL